MPISVYILALTTFAVGTQTYVFTGLLSGLANDVGVSVALAGQLISAIAAPLIVNIISWFYRRKILIRYTYLRLAIS